MDRSTTQGGTNLGKVGANTRVLAHEKISGVERYTQEILRHLPDNVRRIRPPNGEQRGEGHFWEQFILPGQMQPGEILWSPANTGPLAFRRQVLTLHDLSWLEHPEWYAPVFALWYRCLIPTLVRQVRHITVPSESVRNKILGKFSIHPEKVSVVPGGVDGERFKPMLQHHQVAPERYVLFTSTLQPRKNLAVLWEAWKTLQSYYPDLWLLVAGAVSNNFRGTPRFAQTERVKFLGYVPEDDLPSTYAGAAAFVLPSIDEGFGLPALEALACGIPVITSNAGALREVVGDAGLFFDPYQAGELVELLHRCLTDGNLRAELAEKGPARARTFSWQKAAGKMWKVLQTCQ